MKILHILNHSLPHTDGYSVRSSHIVHGQARLGLDVAVVTSPHHEPEPSEAVEVIAGTRYYRVVPTRVKRVPYCHELHAVCRLRARIGEVIRIEQPDVVHAHSPSLWGAAAWRAARRRRLPLVYEMRGLWQGETDYLRVPLKYRLGRLLETLVAKRADAVTVISRPLRDDLASRGVSSRKIFVVPNGVDLNRFVPLPRDEQLAASLNLDGQVCLGYLGSLYPFEGVDDLLFAMKSVTRRAPNTRLLIVGGGNQAEAVQRLIGGLDLLHCVHFVGRVPHKEVAKYYSVMDVMVYPRKRSRTTDLVTPLKPLEAMAMGKPVLASDVGGLRALLGEAAALYFRSEDREHLADRCLQLVNSPEHRAELASRARQHVRQSHNWSQLIEGYQQVYQFAREARFGSTTA